MYLRRFEALATEQNTACAWSVPAIQTLRKLSFDCPITFFVGENGSGKSTLLEAIALRASLPPATGAPLTADDTLDPVRPLAKTLRLGWRPRTHQGFFLRAEDFFGFIRNVRQRKEAMDSMADRFADDARVQGYMRAQKAALEDRYGADPHARSHGESFLDFFLSRCVPSGLHLIDEPEAALSPQRQLAFVSLLKELSSAGAQFIIATHSPIILACPGASCLHFDETGLHALAYDDLPHVTLLRSFLAAPERFVRDL